MEAISEPIKGPWVVKDVGYDVVLLEGPEGVMTVKMALIVSILVEPKKAKELQVEKSASAAP